MPSVFSDEIVEKMVSAIVHAAHPERIYLFGSRGRGNPREDSDVDLLVVEQEPFGPLRNRFDEANRLALAVGSVGVDKDILVYSSDEADFWGNTTNHVIARARREGRLVYERP